MHRLLRRAAGWPALVASGRPRRLRLQARAQAGRRPLLDAVARRWRVGGLSAWSGHAQGPLAVLRVPQTVRVRAEPALHGSSAEDREGHAAIRPRGRPGGRPYTAFRRRTGTCPLQSGPRGRPAQPPHFRLSRRSAGFAPNRRGRPSQDPHSRIRGPGPPRRAAAAPTRRLAPFQASATRHEQEGAPGSDAGTPRRAPDPARSAARREGLDPARGVGDACRSAPRRVPDPARSAARRPRADPAPGRGDHRGAAGRRTWPQTGAQRHRARATHDACRAARSADGRPHRSRSRTRARVGPTGGGAPRSHEARARAGRARRAAEKRSATRRSRRARGCDGGALPVAGAAAARAPRGSCLRVGGCRKPTGVAWAIPAAPPAAAARVATPPWSWPTDELPLARRATAAPMAVMRGAAAAAAPPVPAARPATSRARQTPRAPRPPRRSRATRGHRLTFRKPGSTPSSATSRARRGSGRTGSPNRSTT